MARVTFKITRDDVSPTLSRMARAAKNPQKIFRAMGNVFKSITEGNFNSAGSSMRPTPWPAKKDGSPSNLKKSGLLWHSFHLEVTNSYAKLFNPTPYAAIHQFGGVILPKNGKALVFQAGGKTIFAKKVTIPARPFFPVTAGKLTPAAEKLIGAAGEKAAMREFEGK